jgi:hypothetical protein
MVPPNKVHEFHWSGRGVQAACTSGEDPEPADFFGQFGCGSSANNEWFCDRRFDADLRRARMLERTDRRAANALFTKLDREATDRAIFLPLVNLHFLRLRLGAREELDRRPDARPRRRRSVAAVEVAHHPHFVVLGRPTRITR